MKNDIRDTATENMPSFSRLRTRLLITGVVFALCIVTGTLSLITGTAATEAGRSTEFADVKRLEGKWFRPDCGYILELRNIDTNGSVQALFFNPRRIDVDRAELTHNGKITLIIGLHDINNPGSYYNLSYDPKTDRLIGSYFQTADKATHDVEFDRAK